MSTSQLPAARPAAILFDMGGVLLDPADKWDAAEFAVSFPEGLPELAPFDWFLAMSQAVLGSFLALKPPRPAMDVRPMIASWIERIEGTASPDAVEKWFDVMCRWEARPVYDFVPGALHALHDLGIRMGVVSNTLMPARYVRGEFDRAGIADLFECTIFSAEFGVNKPDPAIFRHALDAMGVRGEDAWYIGDKPQRDARGAHGAGMFAVIVDGPHAARTGETPADVPDLRIPSIAALPGILGRLPAYSGNGTPTTDRMRS